MNERVRPSRDRALFMLLVATLFWGLSFPLAKALYAFQTQNSVGDTFSLTALSVAVRFFSAALVLAFGLGRGLKNLSRREFAMGAGLAAFGGIAMVFQMDGLQHTTVSTSAFLTQLYCVVIPLFKSVRQRKPPPFRVILSVSLAVAGFILLSGFSLGNLRFGRGEIETALCALLFAGQILWLERPSFHACNAWRSSCVMFLLISLFVFPLALIEGGERFMLNVATYDSWRVVFLTSLLVLFCTLASYILMNLFQPSLDATEAGLIYSAEPVFATLLAIALPPLLAAVLGMSFASEVLTSKTYLGGLFILSANVALFAPVGRRIRNR